MMKSKPEVKKTDVQLIWKFSRSIAKLFAIDLEIFQINCKKLAIDLENFQINCKNLCN